MTAPRWAILFLLVVTAVCGLALWELDGWRALTGLWVGAVLTPMWLGVFVWRAFLRLGDG